MKYFDFAATTPMKDEVLQVYSDAAKQYYGNTSSLHNIGTTAEHLLQGCRSALANLLEVQADGLYFTSGGSESNFLAIYSLAKAAEHRGKHMIVLEAEHSSVHQTTEKLQTEGWSVTNVAFPSNGIVDIEQLKAGITQETTLVVVQHANSEIGTIQPLREIKEQLKQYNILLHADCVQTFGKLDLKEITPYVDSLSISSHKVYGPKGVGAAYVNPQLHWQPFLSGVSHEKGFRSGTVNVPGIAAFIAASTLRFEKLEQLESHWSTLRKELIHALEPIKEHYTLFGSEGIHQLPSILGLKLHGIEGQYAMLELNRRGFAVSTGSACHVGQQSPSKTMVAISEPTESAKQFIRISFGEETTIEDTNQLGKALIEIVNQFHKQA